MRRLSSGRIRPSMSCRWRWMSEPEPEDPLVPEPEQGAEPEPEPGGTGLRPRGTTSAAPLTAYTYSRLGLQRTRAEAAGVTHELSGCLRQAQNRGNRQSNDTQVP